MIYLKLLIAIGGGSSLTVSYYLASAD